MPMFRREGLFVFLAVRDRCKLKAKGGGEYMKTGIIVYVAGDDALMDPDQHARTIKDRMHAEQVEIVSRRHGHYDVSDAWWTLTAKGMHRIICLITELSGFGDLILTDRQFRLSG